MSINPFEVDDQRFGSIITFVPTMITPDKIRLKGNGWLKCIIEKSGEDVFVITHFITHVPNNRKHLIDIKFLLLGDHMIPLFKRYEDSFATSGHWGKLPTGKGYINADKQIKHNDSTDVMFSTIVDGVAKCYCSYGIRNDDIDTRVGEVTSLSHFWG